MSLISGTSEDDYRNARRPCSWRMTGQRGEQCEWVCDEHGERKTTFDGKGGSGGRNG